MKSIHYSSVHIPKSVHNGAITLNIALIQDNLSFIRSWSSVLS